MKPLLMVGCIFFMVGCCTKKACQPPPVDPTVQFYLTKDTLTGFKNDEILSLEIIRLDKVSHLPIDSFAYFFSQDSEVVKNRTTIPIFLNSEYIINRSGKSVILKDSDFILAFRKANALDTLSGVDYTLVSNPIHCNYCFPWGITYANETSVVDFQYHFNGILKTGMSDSTLIHR